MSQIKEILSTIESFPLDEKVEAINELRRAIHEISPFKNEPVDLVLWVKNESVYANDYNPNETASTEQKLLVLSIEADGLTQPVVTMETDLGREVVDGFHRTRVVKEDLGINSRVYGYAPVVGINSDRRGKEDRMAATVRHNRARGKHKVESMSEIVMHLKKRNWNDAKIAKHLGMDADEVLRLCQVTGLASAFADREFSEAWEATNDNNDVTL